LKRADLYPEITTKFIYYLSCNKGYRVVYIIEIKHCKKGSYILHKGEPYRIRDIGIVVTGTHSHTKVKLQVEGLFSNLSESFTLPPHERVEEVEIVRKLAQLISKTPDKVQIMDMHSYQTLDADVDTDLKNEINEGNNVTYVEFNGAVKVIEKR
jgi:translation initiation factor 5A